MQVTHIQRDHTLKAVELQSTADYPIRFYLDVMDDFEQTCIHWHWHPELEFNVITRGTIEYYVENEHYTLSAGQGILKNANVLHMAEPAQNTPGAEMFSIIMDAQFIAPARSVIYQKYVAPLERSEKLMCLPLHPEEAWQKDILNALHVAYALSQTESGPFELRIHRLMCQVWQVLYEHAQLLPERAKSSSELTDQVRIKQMIAYIQTHFQEKLSLEDIAAQANISRNSCLSCFRRVLGVSPLEYVIDQRLEWALHLLISSDLTIAEVANDCGFGDASYFGKAFRRRLGLTPSQYRERKRGELYRQAHPADLG